MIKCNTFTIDKKGILNVISKDGTIPKSCIPYWTWQEVQVWFLMSDLDKKRLSEIKREGLFPKIFIHKNNKDYLIFTKNKNNNFIDLFLKNYDSKLLNHNVIFLDKVILRVLKSQIYLDKETSGNIDYNIIYVSNNKNWKYTFIKEENKNHRNGMYDSVVIDYNKITYHTHPIPSYSKKSIKTYAWPSLQDYLTLYDVGQYRKEIIYHILLTREGVYLIIYNHSLHPEYNKKNIQSDMDYFYDTISLEEFLTKINHLKSGFITKFKKWDDEIIFKF